MVDRTCFRDPVPQIGRAAELLRQAVDAHLAGHTDVAEGLIREADVDEIREWTESIWGKKSPYVIVRPAVVIPDLPVEARIKARMPAAAERRALHLRDGYNCRFCGIPVIRKEVRDLIKAKYPVALGWSQRNADCHAAFQAMWAQYDHILPHSKGGNNDPDNMVVTCAPCNFGRMNYTLEEVGLSDPRTKIRPASSWNGLEDFR